MKALTAREVRTLVLELFDDKLRAAGLVPADLPDDFDLWASGVIDSTGVMEMIVTASEAVEEDLDFEELDEEELTKLGPFARFVAEKSGAAAGAE